MKTLKNKLADQIRKYHFEFKHLLLLFFLLVLIQIFLTALYQISLRNFTESTQRWYVRESAEKLANLTTMSLELILENSPPLSATEDGSSIRTINAFNLLLGQSILQEQVRDVCVVVNDDGNTMAIDDGESLYHYVFEGDILNPPLATHNQHVDAVELFRSRFTELEQTEQIFSQLNNQGIFHVLVPFLPKGELVGAVYMQITPDLTLLTSAITSTFYRTSLLFTGLILLGFLTMFYISSTTIRERDKTHRLLAASRERQIEKDINYKKEAMFTKRIYHTHHKAEKVMGFIKEDLTGLSADNIFVTKERITKYANFISRVIYDMKWYDQPLHAIRNPLFQTNINTVIRFLIDNLFLRISSGALPYRFDLRLDDKVPVVNVNEFVVWEILEPLIQNCIDHGSKGGVRQVEIVIETKFHVGDNVSKVRISDDGPGIEEELLGEEKGGVQRIFMENVSTKADLNNSGYGCYIAHEISTQRCGWSLEAKNTDRGGLFILKIPHNI